MIFKDRQNAGILLASKLLRYRGIDSIVYALPRGGVVVGAEIAKMLNIPLDVAIAKKVGHPFNPEYAVCAVSESGETVCDEEEKQTVDENWLKNAIDRAKKEVLLRRRSYSKIKSPISAKEKIAILADDGIATGLTMKAAIKWVKNQKPEKIVVAVPVIPKETVEELKKEVDEVVALDIPEQFLGAIGAYYIDFSQVTDDEVERLLSEKYE
ncbi:MAG: phosphoribosyl transferase [Patescibacteria group bacterium]|nr:phosphoribosyl transferase [Patescibacteria group bacterium]